ncbi:CBS domain-containing protein [Candidatus Woesearchaeota archaeon]|nr:CBS domain-containing protein [Candidatus Woesearchaeota archaeon]
MDPLIRNKKQILACALFIFIIILSFSIFSVQPSLPTYVCGRVINLDSTPAQGVPVRATYTDSTGKENTIETRTLTSADNPDRGLLGNFFFNRGYLQAAEGSTITIEVEGITKKVGANPGGGVVNVPVIILVSQKAASAKASSAPASAAGTFTGATEPSGTSTGATASGSSQWVPGTESPVGEAGGMEGLPDLPTAVYSQFSDEQGDAFEGEDAGWVDENSIKYNATTTTSTKEEAKAQLSIRITSGNSSEHVSAKPGESVRGNVLYSFSSQEESGTEKTRPAVREVGANVVNVMQGVLERTGEGIRDNFTTVILPAIIILLLLAVLYWRRIKKKVKEAIVTTAIKGLNKDIKKLMNLRVGNFMAKKSIAVGRDENIMEAMDLLITGDEGLVVVVEGRKPVGMITEKGLLEKIDFKRDISRLKVRDIMISPVKSISPDATLIKAISFSLKNNLIGLPVTKKDRLVGIVSRADLIREFGRFTSKNMFESSIMSSARRIMSKNILLAEEDESVFMVLNSMLKKDADTVIVSGGETSRIFGILTYKDIIGEIFKNPFFIKKLKIIQVMNQNVFSVSPYAGVYDVIKVMLDNGPSVVPILDDGVIKGVITQKEVLKAVKSFLSYLSSKKVDGLKKIMVPR